MSNNPPLFKGLDIRIPIIIPIKGRRFINQGSALLVSLHVCSADLHGGQGWTRVGWDSWAVVLDACLLQFQAFLNVESFHLYTPKP